MIASADRNETERTCIVTRESAPVDALIRFVVAPDGSLVPDLRRKLPGRGLWVTARADCVAQAERKKLFARAHRGPVTVESGLAGRVEEALAGAAVQALSMARKGGTLVAGFAKVEAAIAKGTVAIIHAAEAAPDGMDKLAAAIRRHGAGGKPVVIRCFTADQLSLAFGGANVIHAALLAGPASRNVISLVDRWLAYRGGDEGRPGRTGPDHAENGNLTETSSGPRNE